MSVSPIPTPQQGSVVHTSTVEEVVSKLRRLKATSEDALRLVPVTGGDPVSVAKAALRQCPYFGDLLNKQPSLEEHSASCSRDTLLFFKAFLELEKRLPSLNDAFDAILFGLTVQSMAFVSRCVWSARGLHPIPGAKAPDVHQVVQCIVTTLPLRTAEQYEALLGTTTSHLSTADRDLVIDRVIEVVNQHKSGEILDPLPIPLFKKRVTAAIMKDVLDHQTIVILHNNRWIPFNVFGSRFCPFAENVLQFHLLYNSYVVYETSDGQVLMRNLRTEASDERSRRLFFDRCKFFRSRLGSLLVISVDENAKSDCLYEWSDSLLDFEKRLTMPLDSLHTAYKNRRGDIVGVLTEGRTIELSNTPPDTNRQGLADCVDDCQLRLGETVYTHLGVGSDNSPCQMPLQPPIHIGDNRLSVVNCGGEVYKTQFWRRVENYWKVGGYSKPHGSVKCFSDVLLVEPYVPSTGL